MKTITAAEQRVMKMYWKYGASTVSELISHIKEPKPAHSTISTITRILEQKNYLTHKTYGRTHLYIPLISKEEYKIFTLRLMTKDLFTDSPISLISCLVDQKEVNKQELLDLINKLEDGTDTTT